MKQSKINWNNPKVKWIAPLLVLVGGFVLSMLFIVGGPTVKPQPAATKLPGVQTLTVTSEDISIPVNTRGIVDPGIKAQLTSAVSGAITKISSKLENGAFFKKGDFLLSVDKSGYEMELDQAEAQFASAKLNLDRTRATTRSSDIEGIRVGKKSEFARGVPQLREAKANYKAAESLVALKKKLLRKTTVRAPFDGRVLEKMVNSGGNVAAGAPIATIYSIDKAVVRLPLSDSQLELIDIPDRYVNEHATEHNNPMVILRDSENKYTWRGKIVRSEGNINPANRLTYVVAEVDSPYARDPSQPDRPPLAAGTFVEALIQGRTHRNVSMVPLEALHDMDSIWVLDDNSRIHEKTVHVLYRGKDRVYISSGLSNGDEVVLTPLDVMVENMEVAVMSEAEPLPPVVAEELFGAAHPTQQIAASTIPTPANAAAPNVAHDAPAMTMDTPDNDAVNQAPDPDNFTDDMGGMMDIEQEGDI